MVNLIAGEQIVPELVQADFTAQNIVTRLREILPDGAARDRMLQGLVGVKGKLRAPESSIEGQPQHPAVRAAEIILHMSRKRKKDSI
jgi:lipid A disaccharide synthetase